MIPAATWALALRIFCASSKNYVKEGELGSKEVRIRVFAWWPQVAWTIICQQFSCGWFLGELASQLVGMLVGWPIR